ncbi:hypothetical protein [Photorhabdus tasmaniensis]|uniref:hypothetical protein n=1 Tax=Photorhabdus tasmaniensis TaxID=1004159 RepID=UPI00140C0B77|nr:hypothetical protein [Photorhabdus tasmaniensis]
MLRGTGTDIEGAIAINYEEYEGKPDASFSVMSYMGKEMERHSCLTDTIKTGTDLLYRGIDNVPLIH